MYNDNDNHCQLENGTNKSKYDPERMGTTAQANWQPPY
jgi:hypothetical protein